MLNGLSVDLCYPVRELRPCCCCTPHPFTWLLPRPAAFWQSCRGWSPSGARN